MTRKPFAYIVHDHECSKYIVSARNAPHIGTKKFIAVRRRLVQSVRAPHGRQHV